MLLIPRKRRTEIPGMVYHVICRAHNRDYALKEDVVKSHYLNIVKHAKIQYDFSFYAFCIMDNHIHLLIRRNRDPLAVVMKSINQVFAQWINKRYERTGHIFEQRYHAVLIETSFGVANVIKYIHRNPLMAGMSQGLQYSWNSHSNYINQSENEWFNVKEALSFFGNNSKEALVNYKQFVSDPLDIEIMIKNRLLEETDLNIFENKCIPGISERFFGSDSSNLCEDAIFQSSSELKTNKTIELHYSNFSEQQKTEMMLARLCLRWNVDVSKIVLKRPSQKVKDIKAALIHLNQKYQILSDQALADRLSITEQKLITIRNTDLYHSNTLCMIEDYERNFVENR